MLSYGETIPLNRITFHTCVESHKCGMSHLCDQGMSTGADYLDTGALRWQRRSRVVKGEDKGCEKGLFLKHNHTKW